MMNSIAKQALIMFWGVIVVLGVPENAHSAFDKKRDSTKRDTTKSDHAEKIVQMKAVSISTNRTAAVTTIPHIDGTALYVGKKAERINLRALAANTALNNTRQIFAQSPGVFLWENDGSGIQANVGVRGLSPNRSWEFNVRQNGYDISSDPFGYPEAYYTPPFEMLETIDIVRGASSLQYGPQFGGLLNYVTKSAPQNREIALESSQMLGAGNLYSTYTALGGTLKTSTNEAFDYYAGFHFKRGDAWRQNNSFSQYVVLLKLGYTFASGTRLGLEATRMDYLMQQPAGLTEEQYAANPRQGLRSRDWFSTPWWVGALTLDHKFSEASRLSIKAFGLLGDRNSIGLTTSTAIPDNGNNRRRVNHDMYANIGAEARLLNEWSVWGMPITLATGLRFSRGSTLRQQGRGFDGGDANFSFAAPLSRDLNFVVVNAAAFAEAKISLSESVSISPGVRLERIASFGSGSFTREYGATTARAFDTLGTATSVNMSYAEYVPLAGIGLSVYLAPSILPSLELYGNIAQAYRPALFSDQFQNDLTAVDPNIRSSTGFSSDIGVRGSIGAGLRWDVSAFFVRYNNRVGVLPASVLNSDERLLLISGATALRTNIAASQHIGAEFLVSTDFFKILGATELAEAVGSPSLFVSGSYTDAQYVRDTRAERISASSAPVTHLVGKRVEFAPEWMVRSGLTYTFRDDVSLTFQMSYVGKSYSNAANTESQADGQQGIIPEYTVADLSFRCRVLPWLSLEGSVNNIFDNRYFTRRGTGYPGPGIIPAEGRMWLAGVRVNW
ncbi:MAG: TonB-dependent receptor family protein [Candidatus Kapaibacteriota bacterium]